MPAYRCSYEHEETSREKVRIALRCHLADLIREYRVPPADIRVTPDSRRVERPEASSGCGSPADMCANY